MYFRVEFMVAENKLGRSLAALTGIAYGSPSVQPVNNVVEGADGHLMQQTRGAIVEQFREHLKEKFKAGDQIKSGTAKEFLRTIGRSEEGYSSLVSQAVKKKLVRKNPPKRDGNTKTGYTVLAQKEVK